MHVVVGDLIMLFLKHSGLIKFFTITWNSWQLAIFDLLETHQGELYIKFNSITQMNLEQIFIDLSRKQFAAKEEVQSIQHLSSTRL